MKRMLLSLLGPWLAIHGPAVTAQTVSSRIALPPGTYRLGLVTSMTPPTIDLTAADGVTVEAKATLIDRRGNATLGTMTITRLVASGAQGKLDAGSSRPAIGDLAAFRASDAPPTAASAAPAGRILRALPEAAHYVLSIPPEALVATGDRLPFTAADGRASHLEVRRLERGQARVLCFGAPAIGAIVPLPGRVLVVPEPEGGPDRLVGKTAYVRFRSEPEGLGTSYFHGEVLAVDRARADGPAPCFTARFETKKGPRSWVVTPDEIQHLLILENVPETERAMALAAWEKERDEVDEPHRKWEKHALRFYRLAKLLGSRPTAQDVKKGPPGKSARKPQGFDPSDLFFPPRRR
ncbi:MAG: hypothetical protein AB7I30_01260 [Isosphaeraceae bacterium]